MADEFIIDAGKTTSQQRISDRSFKASNQPITAEAMDHLQPSTQAHDVPFSCAAPWMTETMSWDSAVAILNIRP